MSHHFETRGEEEVGEDFSWQSKHELRDEVAWKTEKGQFRHLTSIGAEFKNSLLTLKKFFQSQIQALQILIIILSPI